MRKVCTCLFYGLCVFTIAFSLCWMAQPKLTLPHTPSGEESPVSSLPNILAQAQPDAAATRYYLCDEGGRVAVYTCNADGTPERLLTLTGIYVNLLPEGDALRIKHGLTLQSERELRQLLEDLGG